MSQLALALPPPIATRARKLRGIVCFEDEAGAALYLARNGDLYVGKPATMRLKARKVDQGYVLCSFWSGYPWCLATDKTVRRVAHEDVR